MTEAEVILVGAGPIGLELAVCLKHAGSDYVQLDAGQVGQTITWYPRQTRFFSGPDRIAIAGVPLNTVNQEKATGEEYLAYLRGVVQQFDLKVRTYEKVTRATHGVDGFEVQTPKDTYRGRHLVLAIGDMHAPRRLAIPGEDLPHVSHYFDEPHRYFQKRLLIVGGKNSAVEAAIRCARAGADVTLSYRKQHFDAGSVKYWLLPELESLIKTGRVTYHPRTTPVEIAEGRAVLGSVDDSTRSELAADFVLLLTGYLQDKTLFEQLGVELEGANASPVLEKETMQTSVPGLYVAGTAVAGTQERFRLFIENSHPHVTRIVRAITGQTPPPQLVNDAASRYNLAES